MKSRIIFFFVFIFVIGSIAAQGDLAVKQSWVRETPPGVSNGAVYFTIVNAGEADQLIRISTDVAERAELHTHIHQDGVMQMRKVEAIDIPAGGQAVLEPHGNHVMLIDLKQPLKAGEAVMFELEFKQGETLTIQAPVRKEPPEP